MITKNGYSEVEIYGLKIRATDDQRIEIDVKEKGNSVDRIYVEFDFDDGCALIYTHNGELNEKLPFNVASLAASTLGRKGGSSTSPAKRKASAENGNKGGRPEKRYDIVTLLADDGASEIVSFRDFKKTEPMTRRQWRATVESKYGKKNKIDIEYK